VILCIVGDATGIMRKEATPDACRRETRRKKLREGKTVIFWHFPLCGHVIINGEASSSSERKSAVNMRHHVIISDKLRNNNNMIY